MPGIKSLFDYTEQPFSTHFKGRCLSCAVHLHTDHSIDGGSTVKDTIQRCAELGMTHISVTEHGELSSAAAIHRLTAEYNKKNKTNLKIIHGVEGYLYWPGDQPNDKGIVPTCHITIGFKTQQAFEAYCKLTPDLFTHPRLRVVFGESKPGMYWEDFLTIVEHGVVIGTGCVGSWLNKPILDRGNIEEAKKRLDMMIEAVGRENIYDEFIVDDISKHVEVPKEPITGKKLFDQATLEDLKCKAWFMSPDIGKECNRIRWESITKPAGIKRLFSQDAHYARKSDKIVQDNKRYNNDWIMSMFQHLKGAEEISLLGQQTNGLTEKECEELIDNTHSYAEHFSSYRFRTAATDGYLIPKYEGDNRAFLLSKVAEVGRIDLNDPVVSARVNYELDVLSSSDKMDGLSYMRMVGEIQEMAAEAKNLMNARGSGGGSLLAYGMGITVTEPIKYDLPFERFLTVGRIESGSLPDFDLDFASKHEMNNDISKRWGVHVAPLSIDMLLKPRSAMKDVERFHLGGVRQETEILTKSMPPVPQGVNETDWLFGYEDELGDHITGHFEKSKELQQYAEDNPEIWETVVTMCGVIRQKSIHACISPEELCDSGHNVRRFIDCDTMQGKAINTWSSGTKQTIRLMLNNGVILNCTADHKVMIKGEEVEAKDTLKLEVDFKPFTSYYGGTDIDTELAFFAGWKLRDGFSTGTLHWIFFNRSKDGEVVERFNVFAEKQGFNIRQSKRGDAWSLSGKVPNLLTHKFTGRLPDYFWELTRDCQRAFFSGFMSANGSCFKSGKTGRALKISFKTVSWRLASDLAHWLAAEGVATTFSYRNAGSQTIKGKQYKRSECFNYEISIRQNKEWINKGFRFAQTYKNVNLDAGLYLADNPLKRTWLHRPKRDISVCRIEPGDTVEVFDFNESQENMAYVSGVLVHNCAVIIASEPVHHVMPLTRAGGDGTLATAYAPKDVEYVGGVKVDILGVSALSTIKLCTELIHQRHPDKDFRWGEFPHAPEVYESIFQTGKTESTFQTKTTGITRLCKQTKPKSVNDISNLIALYRPSCLDWEISTQTFNGNAVEYFVACSKGDAQPYYIHPDLQPIFGDTFGIPVFQEQILRTFRDLGDYTYETAEGVRRAIGKKDAKALAEHGGRLKEKVLARGWSPKQGEDLVEMIVASSRYGFNRAHTASYGIVSYNTGYLKHFYPLEWWCAELTVESQEEDKIRDYAGVLGNMLKQPSIVESEALNWKISADGKLVPPLVTIKGIGPACAVDLARFMRANSFEELGATKKPEKIKKPRASKKKAVEEAQAPMGQELLFSCDAYEGIVGVGKKS